MNEIESSPVVEKARAADRRNARLGRPRKEFAGEVEERILGAAVKIFLDHGFEAASMEEIAETARSGKPTIYARFPNKQALFAAAVSHYIAVKQARMRSLVPGGGTVEERLESIGAALLHEALKSDSVSLMRLAIAESRRFHDLGASICRIARERGEETVAQLLGDVEDCPAFGPDRRATAARYFLDLILLPFLMRALAGEDLASLHAEIRAHVSRRVAFFLAACRNGGLG